MTNDAACLACFCFVHVQGKKAESANAGFLASTDVVRGMTGKRQISILEAFKVSCDIGLMEGSEATVRTVNAVQIDLLLVISSSKNCIIH